MTTKLLTKLSATLSEVLNTTLNANQAQSVMDAWNARKSDLSRLVGGQSSSKRRKDPNAPKRPLTAYLLFCRDKRKEVEEKMSKGDTKASATDITSRLGQMWQALSANDRKKYQDVYERNKEKYDNEMQSYVPPVTDGDEEEQPRRRAKKDKTGPKRPLSAYMYFCQDARQAVKTEHPEMKGKEVTTELGRRWQALSDDQKAPYKSRQEQDHQRYETEKGGQPGTTRTKTPAKEPVKEQVQTKPSKTPAKEPAKTPAKEPTRPTKVEAKPPAKVPVSTQPESKSKGKGKESKKEQKEPGKKSTKNEKNSEVKKTPGYEVFMDEQRDDIEGEHPDWNEKKVLAEVNKRWKELKDDDRDAYELEGAQQSGSESGFELEDD